MQTEFSFHAFIHPHRSTHGHSFRRLQRADYRTRRALLRTDKTAARSRTAAAAERPGCHGARQEHNRRSARRDDAPRYGSGCCVCHGRRRAPTTNHLESTQRLKDFWSSLSTRVPFRKKSPLRVCQDAERDGSRAGVETSPGGWRRWGGLSCGGPPHLSVCLWRLAKKTPVDVRPQLFARDYPPRLSLDVDSQGLPACLAVVGNVPKVAGRRSTGRRKGVAGIRVER